MAIRLIAIDIDGTLLDSRGHLPPQNRSALHAATAAGIEIAIATGRRFDFARPVVDAIGCAVTTIASNGALVRLPDHTTPLRRLMPAVVARAVLDTTADWRLSAGIVFDRPREGQVVFEQIDWSHPARRSYAERNTAFIVEQRPLEAALTDDPLHVMFNGSVAEMRALVDHLRHDPVNEVIELAITEYTQHDFALVDVLPKGCSKGAMLRDWMGHRGYHRDEVMAIGDNLNDEDMLEAVGCPVVMANAVPTLLTRGWQVTASHDAAGVAQAIERWALPVAPVQDAADESVATGAKCVDT